MDARFQGVARGVGTAKIHGRIHLALMTLGAEVFEITLTVMDSVGGGYDVLLGLDMLRKHMAIIDLQADCLRIGDASVPFLGEKDIPLAMRSEAAAPADGDDNEDGPISTDTPAGADAGAASATPGAAAGAAPAPSGGGAAGTSGAAAALPSAVERIMELGFTTEEAEGALRANGGDAARAIEMLASAKFGQ